MSQVPLIYIVDGQRGSASLVKLCLEESGYRTQTFFKGRQVLVSILETKPDLIIFNSNITDLTFQQFAQYLNKEQAAKAIEIIFVTDSPGDGKEIGFSRVHIIQKPYERGIFLKLIGKILGSSVKEAGNLHDVGNISSNIDQFVIDPLPERELTQEQVQPSGPVLGLRELEISPEVIAHVPAKFVRHYKFLPTVLENNILTVATSRPENTKLCDDIFQFLGYNVVPVLAAEDEIEEAIKKYYGIGGETVDQIISDAPYELESTNLSFDQNNLDDIAKMAEDASVIKLVNQILLEAIAKNSSDIHIEPYQGSLKLRYRVDGVLVDSKVPDNIIYFLPAIISRIKIMSGLNIVERRLPQDGRAKVNIKNEKYDLRVSTIPTGYGESVVIRVLPGNMIFSLEKLGLLERDFKSLQELIKRPHGMIFVTGPTGSGKSTTLYAILNQIKLENPGAKIITIEDPVENQLEGVTQVQVNPEIGFTFAKALRSFLRHDPDIMMVGEVRDFETAEMAIRMSLTGHLLFATLHTNDASSGVARLLDIGVEPYLLSSSVIAFMAQRLVRTICQDCKVEVEKSDLILQEIQALRSEIESGREARVEDSEKVQVEVKREQESEHRGWLRKGEKCYRGAGCKSCNFSGYKGRTSLYELLIVTEGIQQLINQKASAEQIKKEAIRSGMWTLYQNGFDKVVKGITTFEEILRVVRDEEGST